MEKQLTDIEKQQLLTIFYVHKIRAPGLDRLAFRLVESISLDSERTPALLTLSYYLAGCGNFALAEEVARQQLQGYARAAALAVIGTDLANTNSDRAVGYLQDAESLLKEVGDSDERAALLPQISRGYSKVKDWQRAKALADQISPTEDRVSALCEIAESLWRAGELGQAQRTLAAAHELANQTQPSARTGALNDVAKVLAQMNQVAEATTVWEEAIAFASYSTESAKWLFSICEKLISTGSRQRAREVALLIKNDARRKQALSLFGET